MNSAFPAAPTAQGPAGSSADEFGHSALAGADPKMWNKVRKELSEFAPGQVPYNPGNSLSVRFSYWINAHGRLAILCGVLLGLAVPELAQMLRPYLSTFLIAVLAFSLAQADFKRVRTYANRGPLVVGLMMILLLLSPTLIALETKVVLVPYGLPVDIANGMILAALAPPLLAAPAIALLLGLDSVLALMIALIGHLVAPFAISMLMHPLIGPELVFSNIDMLVRLVLIIGPGLALGLLVRATPHSVLPASHRQPAFETMLVLSLTLMAIAITAGVTEMAIKDPTFMLWAIPCAFLLNPLLQLLGASIFVRTGYQTSLTVGLLAGYRNVGLLVAVLGGIANEKLLMFLAVVTVSAFVIPFLSGPVLRKVRRVGFDDE